MFSTVRYFIKTSIIFLIVGILTGIYIALARYVFHWGYNQELISAHTHLILVGSVMMMIMGVALWFFPRPLKQDTRYNPNLIFASYLVMTISTALRFVFQVSTIFFNSILVNYLIVLSSIAQVFAMILFFYSIWGRIRPVGSQLRESKGEKF